MTNSSFGLAQIANGNCFGQKGQAENNYQYQIWIRAASLAEILRPKSHFTVLYLRISIKP